MLEDLIVKPEKIRAPTQNLDNCGYKSLESQELGGRGTEITGSMTASITL